MVIAEIYAWRNECSTRGTSVIRDRSSGRMAKKMLKIEIDREEDGRWIGEVPELPGVLAYGATPTEAQNRVTALALRVIADRLEHGEPSENQTGGNAGISAAQVATP